MKTLLKISALALVMSFSHVVGAATTNLGTLATSGNTGFEGSIAGKNTTFTDTFQFNLASSSNLTSSVDAVFNNSQWNFSSFTVELYNVTKNSSVSFYDVVKLNNGQKTSGFINTFNLATGDNYEIRVNGVTSNATDLTSLSKSAYTGTISVSAVPEAEEWAMMFVGLGLIGVQLARKNSGSQSTSA